MKPGTHQGHEDAMRSLKRRLSDTVYRLLRSCRRRGMTAPVLAVGDGALGFWKALRDVFPATREQRCWFRVSSNVLAALPKSVHQGAKAALAEIYNAEDRDHALQAVKAFEADYGAKWPKAVAKITEHIDVLLAFYDHPAEHWIHLRTTNPIESTFATVRLRQRITKGPGSRAAGVSNSSGRFGWGFDCRSGRLTVYPGWHPWCSAWLRPSAGVNDGGLRFLGGHVRRRLREFQRR